LPADIYGSYRKAGGTLPPGIPEIQRRALTRLEAVGYKPWARWSKGASLIAWWLSWIPATMALISPLWWLPKTALFLVLAGLPIGFGYVLDASRDDS
jgi:hypothetical protein